MLIAELLALYLMNHLIGKPSYPVYERIQRQTLRSLTHYEVDQIPVPVLLKWWTSLSDRPSHANKSLGLYRAAHTWAEGLGLLTTRDQTAGIKKYPESTRAQTTSPDEWAKIVPWIEDLKLRYRVCFWALYLLGNRPGEVRTMQTAQLFLDREIPVWVRPTSKNRRPQVKPIPAELVPLLRMVIETNPPGTVYLFWGVHPSRPWGRTSMQKRWEKIRAKVGLEHLWLNDLRRSVASDLLNAGENLGVVQGALHHRSLSQTAKYAWLAIKPLASALQERTDDILARL